MDFTRPDKLAPCTCDQLHHGKRASTLFGSFEDHRLVRRFFAWDDCPRDGCYAVADSLSDFSRAVGNSLYRVIHHHAEHDRRWMYDQGAYRHGLEAPWTDDLR